MCGTGRTSATNRVAINCGDIPGKLNAFRFRQLQKVPPCCCYCLRNSRALNDCQRFGDILQIGIVFDGNGLAPLRDILGCHATVIGVDRRSAVRVNAVHQNVFDGIPCLICYRKSNRCHIAHDELQLCTDAKERLADGPVRWRAKQANFCIV